MLMLLLAFLCLGGALVLAAGALTQPRREQQASLRRAVVYGGSPSGGATVSAWGNTSQRHLGGLARVATRLDPRATVERAAQRLVSAGMVRTASPQGFLATKVLAGSAGVVGGALAGILRGSVGWTFALAVGFGALGFFGPDLYLGAKTRSRRERIQRELPDALDILAVSVEAGLGFDAALAKVGEHMRGPLVEELTLVLHELRVGETRANALKKMAERVDVPEVQSFVQALLYADQLGSPLGKVLKVQAAEARQRRQLAAEERAMKAPVKMLLPILVFIFPVMFVVILGPAFYRIFEALG
jgi:tight adherence protein C